MYVYTYTKVRLQHRLADAAPEVVEDVVGPEV